MLVAALNNDRPGINRRAKDGQMNPDGLPKQARPENDDEGTL